MQNSNNVGNYALTGVAQTMRSGLPVKYLVGVILSYIVNAGLIAFLLYPVFLRIADGNVNLALVVVLSGSIVVQYFRYLIVFTDQLIPNGVQSSRGIVRFVAFAMWLFSAVEVYHASAGLDWLSGSQFWSLVLFGWGIVSGGYVLEISFVKKINELTDLQVGEGYESDAEVKDRIRQQQDAERAQHSHPTQDALALEKSYAELMQMGYERTKQENEVLREQIEQLKAAQQITKNRPEMERVAAEMQVLNGNVVPSPNGHTLQNRVVISGFQPTKSEDAKATFIKQPLVMGQNACEHCGEAYTPKVNWQKFCSVECRDSHHTEKHGKPFAPGLYHNQQKS